MKLTCVLVIGFFLSGFAAAANETAVEQGKPFGPYYCQARCLASCLETNLAPTLDDCSKFCPPFDENTPCPREDIECWQTCGVPMSDDQVAPRSVAFVPATLQDDLNEDDSYRITLAWTSSANASVYVVEFYPLNRQPKAGEPNFFRDMTTSLVYAVRKEDKCTVYDARVIAVNSFGISVPSTIFIGLPPDCSNDSFPEHPQVIPPAQPPAELPSNDFVILPAISAPGFVPSGIAPSDAGDFGNIDIPTPPPVPFSVDGSAPMPPRPSISIIDSQNGSGVQIVPINQQIEPMCDQDMFDVQPAPNPLSSSLIDLTVSWLERQSLPALPTPTYFTIRYGPIVRYLVDDGRQDYSIMPGYETIVRTGQQTPGVPDPTRHIDIPGLPRQSLLKVQICAIYEPSTEPLIVWDTLPFRRIDLGALEPFLDLETPVDQTTSINMMPPVDPNNVVPPISTDSDDSDAVAPLVIAVDSGIDQKWSNTFYWVFVMVGVLIILSTASLVFICLRRTCKSGQRSAKVESEKVVYYVNAQPTPPPAFSEVVKVPPV